MDQIRAIRSPKRGRRRPQTPNPEVRRRLLDAAAELIQEEGFPDLRVEEITERAGLSVGTFYLYFDSKADLFVGLVMEFTERLRKRMAEAEGVGGTAPERLLRRLDAYLDFIQEYERGFLYFRDVASGIDTTGGKLSSLTLEMHASDLGPLLEEAMASGAARREDPTLTAQAIVGLTQHLAGYWLEHKDACSRDEVRRFISAFIAFGLAPLPPRPPTPS